MVNQTPQPPGDADPASFPVLSEPADGVPPLVSTPQALAEAADRLAAGSGPVAIDAERASGHRYHQRAYLIQLRREGSGTHLIDTGVLTDLTSIAQSLAGTEWILHASTQDLPCLAELGLRPTQLFDTELAARLLGLPRVGLAGLSEDLLGVGLAKGHGAADWSRRPMPPEWLTYAALDVELLSELRENLLDRLRAADRLVWADQEFAYLTTWQPKERVDPWRRTSGINKVSDPRSLAAVRELWNERDAMARSADQPVGRIMKDATLVAIVRADPSSQQALAALPDMHPQRRRVQRWWRALERARALPESELPPRHLDDGPPPQRSWDRRDPAAAARLSEVRAAISDHAQSLAIPMEVLVSPDPVRVVVWEAGGPLPSDEIASRLASLGVRQWQIDEVAHLIAEGLLASST